MVRITRKYICAMQNDAEMQSQHGLEVFDAFWDIIDRHYANFDLSGEPPGSIDWKAIRESHRPRAATAKNEQELFDLLHELVVSQFATTAFCSLTQDSHGTCKVSFLCRLGTFYP